MTLIFDKYFHINKSPKEVLKNFKPIRLPDYARQLDSINSALQKQSLIQHASLQYITSVSLFL